MAFRTLNLRMPKMESLNLGAEYEIVTAFPEFLAYFGH